MSAQAHIAAWRDFAIKVKLAKTWLLSDHAQKFKPTEAVHAAVDQLAKYMQAQHGALVDPVIQGELGVLFHSTHRLGGLEAA